MPVQNWMTTDVVSVGPDTSLLKVGKLMKDHHIRRIPVVDDNGQVVGIISDRDVRDASPSKATTLDMYEMHYLLAELKAKNIMTAKPITVKPTDTVEQAALIMLDNKVGGLPVVDDNGRLVGIISDHDVFKALVDITGARMGGLQFAIELPDQPGTARPLFDLLRAHNARLLSVLTVSNADGNRQLFIRVRDLENSKAEQELMDGVGKLGKVLYCQH
ncbi:Inosine-5'-monophosphate dehydrogenase [bioreactor metagenome]|uniref:CBS domain containing membrane protein n=2 Tax=root TaxID=1 RepID=A0A212JJ37_9BACT|nr:CBS and ACT domain-containing protein [Desulfovibrio desulfuricans]MCB6541718.1 CBS and ACT domain-containing protein [Desulfovibrio desulfuricans]MCB6552799.1 CBS and ACT domain-containing protein [Desulfovibrio desulfuricans]MCB6564579.1 CBS and ACT domain-containing protein [Desulfovibrio desulfuricans]MCB7345824.1 CBS and ACT domain-containing protein [Desulfovibrio desulfuricans]MCQ4861613.1 CBS and ACT domain-containing protein [Desulfovibrio desulfuricans]